MNEQIAGLVVGASGVTGTPMAEQLLAAGWKVYGISRRAPRLRGGPHPNFHHITVDLTDAAATRAALAGCSDVTHVFHCANDGAAETRIAITDNLLDAVEAVAPEFSNINLVQGGKYYGSYLGPFRTPARETDPRIEAGDFYYGEEDLILSRQAGRPWSWTAVRPNAVCGYAPSNPVNLATVLAIYGSLLRELGQPFGFPASPACFEAIFQVMDADILARAAIHVSTTPGCANMAFNVSNGDVFRWKHLWPALAGFFGLEPAGPQPCSLREFLSDKHEVWQRLTRAHGLAAFPFERTPDWAQGSFTPPNSRLACEYDFFFDTLRIRQSGFAETRSSEAMFLDLFAQFRADRVIP